MIINAITRYRQGGDVSQVIPGIVALAAPGRSDLAGSILSRIYESEESQGRGHRRDEGVSYPFSMGRPQGRGRSVGVIDFGDLFGGLFVDEDEQEPGMRASDARRREHRPPAGLQGVEFSSDKGADEWSLRIAKEFHLPPARVAKLPPALRPALHSVLASAPTCCISMEDLVAGGHVKPGVVALFQEEGGSPHAYLFKKQALDEWFSSSGSNTNPLTRSDIDMQTQYFQMIAKTAYVIPLLVGAMFGIGLQRGRVHEALLITGQMTFQHFVMLKMFLSATATSMIGFTLLESKFNFTTTRPGMTTNFHRGIYAVMVGASLLGLGMTLTGSCPGTVFAQLGSGSMVSLVLLLGGISGAFAFSRLLRHLDATKQSGLVSEPKLAADSVSFHDVFNRATGSSLSLHDFSLRAGAALLGFVALLELLVDWRRDLAPVDPAASWATAFPPICSGVLIGCAQIVLQRFASKTLGSSSSYACVLARACPPAAHDCSYLSRMGADMLWQVATMAGVALGAAASAAQADVSYVGAPLSAGLVARLYLGGALLVFGAQLAGGCTSGHGLTGLGFMSTYSALAVACMFGTAIAAGVAGAVLM